MAQLVPSDEGTLSRFFAKRRIPTDHIAFYNHPAFQAAEQRDHSILEFYAGWVRARARGDSYDEMVRSRLPRIAELVEHEVASDGQLGVCVDASMMLTKMLEAQGIWCYAVRGALTITAPELEDPTHFWLFDDTPDPGHVWVVAPPFEIVDISLRTQPYRRSEAKLLPNSVCVESAERIVAAATDYCSDSVLVDAFRRHGPLPRDVHLRLHPALERPIKSFPSYKVYVGSTELVYASGGIAVSDAPDLNAIMSRTWNGRSAGQLYDEIVLPALQIS